MDAAAQAGIAPALALRNAGIVGPDKNTQFQKSISGHVDAMRRGSSLCCFTTKGHNILMFSHYGNSHKGICLQFLPQATTRLGRPMKVNYDQNYPELRYMQLRNKGGELAKSLYLWKHKDWAYEEEHRVIRHGTPAGFVSFQPSDLSGIIFGCKADDKSIAEVKKWIKVGGSSPILYKTEVSRTAFELKIEKI